MSRKELNPYDLSYSHQGQKMTNGTTAFDIGSVTHPVNFLGIEGVTVTHTGDAVIYPNNMEVGMTLKEAKGIVEVSKGTEYQKVLKIAVTDRTITNLETLTIGSTTYDAYLMTYTVKTEKYFNDTWFETTEETIQEWIVPNIGIVKRLDNSTVTFLGNNGTAEQYETEFLITADKITYR